MALGALVLLSWTPATILEPGFQLSFAAVGAIFVAVPRVMRFWEGYPVPRKLAELLTLAAVCGGVTAPIVWLHFGVVPVWTIPANVLAEPAMVPLIGLSLAAALIEPLSASAAAALAWLAGWCAAWITLVARLIGGLPGAQIGSGPAVAVLGAAVLGGVLLVRAPRHRRRSTALVLAVLSVTRRSWLAVASGPRDLDAADRAPRLLPRCGTGRRHPCGSPWRRRARGSRAGRSAAGTRAPASWPAIAHRGTAHPSTPGSRWRHRRRPPPTRCRRGSGSEARDVIEGRGCGDGGGTRTTRCRCRDSRRSALPGRQVAARRAVARRAGRTECRSKRSVRGCPGHATARSTSSSPQTRNPS